MNLHIGVVEDNKDPLFLSRVKVRIVDLHTHDKTVLPTEDLPWANVMHAVGTGIAMPPRKGSQVAVIFYDEPHCQMPLVIGEIPSIPQSELTFIDTYPDYPTVVENITDFIKQPLPKNQIEQSMRDNPQIVTDEDSNKDSGVLSDTGSEVGNSQKDTKASFLEARSGTDENEMVFQDLTTIPGQTQNQSYSQDNVIESIINSYQRNEAQKILGMGGNSTLSIKELTTNASAISSSMGLSKEASNYVNTFGKQNPTDSQKTVVSGNILGSYDKSLNQEFNNKVAQSQGELAQYFKKYQTGSGVVADAIAHINEYRKNLNNIGLSDDEVDSFVANIHEKQSTSTISRSQLIENEVNEKYPKFTQIQKDKATKNYRDLVNYVESPGAFGSLIAQCANMEQTYITFQRDMLVQNFGSIYNQVQRQGKALRRNTTNLDYITGNALQNIKSAPKAMQTRLTDVINQVKQSGMSFTTAEGILSALRSTGGKNINTKITFKSDFVVDPMTNYIRSMLAVGISPMLMVSKLTGTIANYVNSIEGAMTAISTSEYFSKVSSRGTQHPLSIVADTTRIAKTTTGVANNMITKINTAILGMVQETASGNEKAVEIFNKELKNILDGCLEVFNVGGGFVSSISDMIPFGNIVKNLFFSVLSSLLPGSMTIEYEDVGVDSKAVKTAVENGDYNAVNFQALGNLENVSKVGVENAKSTMFMGVGDGNTPPLNGEWGGVNFGGTDAVQTFPVKLDTDNNPSPTENRSVNLTLPDIGGVVITDKNQAQSNLTTIANSCGMDNLELKSAFLAVCYAYCGFSPKVADYDYDTINLLAKFPNAFKNSSEDVINQFSLARSFKKMDEETFYNFVYSSSAEGQKFGNVAKDDGYRYAEYGLLPIVGKSNYTKFGNETVAKEGWKALEGNIPLQVEIASKQFNQAIEGVPYGNNNAVLNKALSAFGGYIDSDVASKAFEHFYGASLFTSTTVTEKTAGDTSNPNTFYGSVTDNSDDTIGFRDPDGKYPYIRERNQSSVDSLARGVSTNTIVTAKEQKRTLGIKTANGLNWDQPPSGYGAKYPYNKVESSESGHIIEVDDTPNAERLQWYHRSGTFEEITANGNKIIKIIGDGYTIYDRNGFISIAGDANLTVSGNIRILCESDAFIESNGSTTLKSHGNLNVASAGDLNLSSGGIISMWGAKGLNLQSEKSVNIRSKSDELNLTSLGNMNIVSDATMFITANENLFQKAENDVIVQGSQNANLVGGEGVFVSGKTADINGDEITRVYGGDYADLTSGNDIRITSGSNLNLYSGSDILVYSGGTFDQKATGYYHLSAGIIEQSASGAFSVSASGLCSLSAGAACQVKAGGNLALEGGGIASISASGNVGVNGALVMLNSGTRAPSISYSNSPVAGAGDGQIAMKGTSSPKGTRALLHGMIPIEMMEAKNPNLLPLDTSSPMDRGEQMVEFDAQANTLSGQILTSEGLSQGGYQNAYNISSDSDAQELMPSGDIPVSGEKYNCCDIPSEYLAVVNQNAWQASTRISPHFILNNFFSGGFERKYHLSLCPNGMKPRDVVFNLAYLANNVLEPILELLPGGISGLGKQWLITSGYRDVAGNRRAGGSSTSQHCMGQAIDIQVCNFTNKQSYELAQRIAQKVDYDQIILEYSAKTGKCWVHTSLAHNRCRSQRLTMNTAAINIPKGGRISHYANGFILFDRNVKLAYC